MATATTTTKATPAGNPKDSMKSTWHEDSAQWAFPHWVLKLTGLTETYTSKDIPVHPATDKVPHVTQWSVQRYVLTYSLAPIILHQAYVSYAGSNFGIIPALIFYSIAYKLIGIRLFHVLDQMGYEYGFLDGEKHKRDRVPDVGVGKVVASLISTATFRSTFTIMLAYSRSKGPMDMSFAWLPVEIGLYGIVLDFWFYWYHRVMHESETLWKYHRTHHLTKHPNPLMTLYADHEQEFFDIAGIPLLAYFSMKLLGFPMGFYEWWICQQYVTFTELSGHSGLRLVTYPPSTLSWLLKALDTEIIIEDHDLHHRRGWKKSGNYGKQTRLWDRIFGTVIERVESTNDNVDWDHPVNFPAF